jgi:hypothetical protein
MMMSRLLGSFNRQATGCDLPVSSLPAVLLQEKHCSSIIKKIAAKLHSGIHSYLFDAPLGDDVLVRTCMTL